MSRNYQPTERATTLKERVLSTLAPTMPDGFHYGAQNHSSLGVEYISIWMRPSNTIIGNVAGQYPAVVSLSLEVDALTLKPQIYGGCGGQTFSIQPPEGSHLASASVKVPFRRPKQTEKAVFSTLERFAKRYVNLLKENVERLTHTHLYTSKARAYLGIPHPKLTGTEANVLQRLVTRGEPVLRSEIVGAMEFYDQKRENAVQKLVAMGWVRETLIGSRDAVALVKGVA